MPSTTARAEKGPMTEPEYPAWDATQGPFSFGSSGFCVDYICRESEKRLRRLLFPELLGEMGRDSAQFNTSIIDRSWTKAQLQHYGINFSPELDPFKAKALLLTSVSHGLCNAVPPQILKIEATLREEYKSTMNDYRDKLKAYRASKLPTRIQAFEACATPTEEAKCDSSLFLQKYFLDKDHNPDRTKTPDLILLPGYTDKGLALTGRTQRVPALHVADAGLEGASHVTVIGWNRERVNSKAHDIDIQQTDGRGILRSSHDWDKQMVKHHIYMENLRRQRETSNPGVGTSFHRSDVAGTYVVESSYIQHEWPILSKQLSLRFFRYGQLAIFDIGIIVGLMVLGGSKAAVSKLVQEKNWDDDSEDEDLSSEDEDMSNGEEESSDKLCVDDEWSSDGPVKRQKINTDHSRRLYFQWRGYNTVSGGIYFDPQNRNTGYLDFADDDATSFKGTICMDVRTTTEFRGYNVPGLTGPLTMNWNALSHLASERAKAPGHMTHIW